MQQNSNLHQWQVGDIMEAPNQNYPNRKFKLLKVLGKGGEGMVFQAESINWNQTQTCALKIHFNKQKDLYIQFLGHLIQYQNQYESPTQRQSQQSQIIKIYDYFYNSHQQFVVVMEFGTQDLYNYYQIRQNLNIQEIGQFCIQIARAVIFLHHNNYIHRDLKPENFIIVGNQIKMIDFGSIKSKNDRMQTKNIGTLAFQAPEILDGNENYTSAIDIWSLGCVFYEIIKQQPLFQQNQYGQLIQLHQQPNKLVQYVQDKIHQLFICDEWKNVLLKIFSLNPADRPNIQSILFVLDKNNIEPKQVQNIFSQINTLISSFQNQDIINHFKQNYQDRQELVIQIEKAKKIYIQLFPENQNLTSQITYNCQNIQEKIELTEKLLNEIKQDQQIQEIDQIELISKLHGKIEANKQQLQSVSKNEEEIQKLNKEIEKSQNEIQENNKIKIQFEELEQYKLAQDYQLKGIQQTLEKFKLEIKETNVTVEITTNQFQEYFTFQYLQIEKQKRVIQNLQQELFKMNMLDQTFQENEKTIAQLQKELNLKPQNETKIYEQNLQISELEFQITMQNNLQEENINQQKQIKELEQQISELQSYRKIKIEQEFQINQLKSQLQYIRQEIEIYDNIEGKLENAKKDLQLVYQQKKEQVQKQEEIRSLLDQTEKEKFELNNTLHLCQVNKDRYDNLKNEVETLKQDIAKLVQFNNFQITEKIKEKNDLIDIINDLKSQYKNQQQFLCMKTDGDKSNFQQNNNQFKINSPFPQQFTPSQMSRSFQIQSNNQIQGNQSYNI